MNKTGRFILILAGMALLLAATAVAAGAAPANTDPTTAAFVDNQTHTIDANGTLWYRFDYAGDRSPITVTLVNGTGSGLEFNVLTPEEAKDWWETRPIGRGTALTLDCTTGEPRPFGECQSDDLTWNGQFNAAGTYLIELSNTTSSNMSFQLTIQGSGVSLGPGPAPATTVPVTPSPAATASVTPASAAPGTNTDPGHAAPIDNAAHMVPAGGSLWYRFDYAGDRSPIILTLLNGTDSGLTFAVWTPAQVGDWWETPPIGRGTAQATNCDSGAPETNGSCAAADLTWVGRFDAAGTYYVQLINNNSAPSSAQLTIQGDGVSLGR